MSLRSINQTQPEACRVSEIPSTLGTLDTRIHSLEERIKTLHSRLESVLQRTPVSINKDTVKEATGNSQLGETINTLAARVNEQVTILEDILSRLET